MRRMAGLDFPKQKISACGSPLARRMERSAARARLTLPPGSCRVLAGCTGTPMNIKQYDSSQYTVIGHSEATATGLLLFGVIPIQQNRRFVRAQTAAIKAKGGDAMINTQVQEN